jgi:hypothetical protein
MPKVGSYFHNSSEAISIAATNAYAVARSKNITNLSGRPQLGAGANRFMLRTLYIEMDTLAGLSAAPTLTTRLTSDQDGDKVKVGDVTASISLGVTDPTKGAVTIAIDFAYAPDSGTDNLFLFWKLDQGTATIKRIDLLTEE